MGMQAARSFVAITVAALGVAAPIAAQRDGCVDDTPTGWEIQIAAGDEPGERLLVEGQVLDREGNPVPGVVVRVFHTDADGWYSPGGTDEARARLCGVFASSDDGRYRLRTILPAPYPTSGAPRPHIHFVVDSDGERSVHTVMWNGVVDGELTEASEGDRSAQTRPVVRPDQPPLRLVYDLRLR